MKMSYQYFNIVNKKSLLLNGPKKGEAYKWIGGTKKTKL